MYNTDWSDAKRARVAAAARPRRIIFNDDTHNLPRDDADTPEGFLAHRIAPLAETQVGTISWSVLCAGFDAPAYDSHVQPIYGDAQGSPAKPWGKTTENIKTLAREHRCPLHLVCDFAHEHDMETFASVRMNDVHDSFMEGFMDANAMTVWKRTHPQFMVDTRGMRPEFELYTTAQDFSHQAVRQRKLEIIEEICERYDVDGFELDYIRHPVLFSRRMRGEPCTAEEIAIITSLMRQIRGITDAAAERRGRPLLIAARVPDSFALCLDNGMGLQAWLDQDLIDILIAGGGYAPFSLPVAQFVEAARPHGVPTYPCLNQGIADAESEGAFLEAVRALAANWYAAGADGLYFWNLGTPFDHREGDELEEIRRACYACLHEVGDPAMLEGKDKLFCVDNGSSDVFHYYRHVSNPPPLPLKSKQGFLRTGVIGRVPLNVYDGVRSAKRVQLTVEIDDAPWQDVLLIRLNGEELGRARFVPAADGKSGGRLEYPVTVPSLRTGWNFIEVVARHTGIPDGVVEISAIQLKVEYEWQERMGAPAGR